MSLYSGIGDLFRVLSNWTVWVALLMLYSLSCARAQMSPGPLAQAHANLDSPLQCTACHALGRGAVQFKCLECHDEIRRRLAEKRGYHTKVVRGSGAAANQDCARCHAEHNGRQHKLVHWTTPPARFDHRQAGWPLLGKHAVLTCDKCHNVLKSSTEDRATLKRTDLSKSYLGLSPSCNICHTDEHHGDLGTDCARCHNLDSWKNPPGFSHDKSAFPLTGLHQKVACAQCHRRLPPATGRVQYKNFGFFDNCRSCHKDVHAGSFAGDCQKCHSTFGWKPARAAEGGFDHAKTDFPLKGRHALVDCKKCHRTENFRAPVPHARCLDCHQDRHKGQFTAREGGECAGCHTESAWKPARFTVKDHASTHYPLMGAHEKVACVLCHAGMGADANYHASFESCRNCHQDQHLGQFAASPHENRW